VRGERTCLARAGASEGGVDGEIEGGRTGRGRVDVKISSKWREGGKEEELREVHSKYKSPT
jgi:hypothetical protein